MLTVEQHKYYQKQIIVSEIGHSGQQILADSRVLIIGAGGLGAPVIQYLAAAGVGRIGIADFDKVALSNLHRQIIYTTQQVGRVKTECAKTYVQQLNPHVQVETHQVLVTEENILPLIKPYDLVIDGTDRLPTKFLINDACVVAGKTFIYGSVHTWEGQVATFNLYPHSPTLRCAFAEDPTAENDCEIEGVIGITTGITGLLMATEAIKVLLQMPEVNEGVLLQIQPLSGQIHHFRVTSVTKSRQIASERFKPKKRLYISAAELYSVLMHAPDTIQLIDVRTPQEKQLADIGGECIPIQDISNNVHKINQEKLVVLYCHHGIRSENAVKFLVELGYKNLKSLSGGIHAWSVEIDPTVPVY